MKIFQYLINFIKSPIYKPIPKGETRIVLKNPEERALKQIELSTNKDSKYYASQNNGHINDGYETPPKEAVMNFIMHNGREIFASQFTCKQRRPYVVKIKNLYQKYITIPKRKIICYLQSTFHFHKKAHS